MSDLCGISDPVGLELHHDAQLRGGLIVIAGDCSLLRVSRRLLCNRCDNACSPGDWPSTRRKPNLGLGSGSG